MFGKNLTDMNKLNFYLLAVFLTFTAVQLNAQQFFFSPERPSSCGSNDGIVTIVPMRGVPPFTYLWSDGSTEVSLHNVPKGTYSATLTDAAGASIVHTHILNSEEFDLTLVSTLPSSLCNPLSGAISINPVGGVAPYTYSWSNGMSGASIQGLTGGTYSVTVQDATGCVALGEYAVEALTFQYYLGVAASATAHPDCANPNAGELSAFPQYYNYPNVYPPYSYAWSNGGTTQTVSNLAKGTYTVTMTDAVGCSAAYTYVLQNDLTLTSNVVCSGSNNGAASAVLVNATAPVSYNWSNGQSGSNLTNLQSGQYAVTATDAAGCTSIGNVYVAIPELWSQDLTPKCYSGNDGSASIWVNYDQASSILWDNGDTDNWAQNLSPGAHTVTVTTNLGCVLTENITIPAPLAPAFTITTNVTAADCSNGVGGQLNLNISGGIAPYSFYAYGPDGFFSSDVNSLQNLLAGSYQLSVYTNNMNGCYGSIVTDVADAGGFEPVLVTDPISCTTGFGSAAVIDVTAPGTTYEWSTGSNAPALFNLTEGVYSVTVSAGGSCNKFFEFYMYTEEDSLQVFGCTAKASGRLINDLGVPGCTGTVGIPYQLIRTLPSGALNFTGNDGSYSVGLGIGAFDIEAANYDPADIACPVGAKHSVNVVLGNAVTGLDFHFLNNNPIDHRVRQTALRTAQPGYPYSLRMEVCNDGTVSNPGVLDLEYGNFLGLTSGHNFPQHPGAFTLTTEGAGVPNNNATFSFPGVAPGACELLQLDLLTPTTTALNTAFLSDAHVSPNSGDPTPDNNHSTMQSTVVGSFDPNCVLAYPARNGNPKDGGDILLYEDKTIVYQIFFQNTGNAPADRVIVRDPLDGNLDVSTIRNIRASHNMTVSAESDNKVLIFKFDNISLPDSTTDYAGSIGSIQYEIDLKPGAPIGTKIEKEVGIFFDFNEPVITNQNVLEIVSATRTSQPSENALQLFPNPTDAAFGFFSDTASQLKIYNSMGVLVSEQSVEAGLQQISTSELPAGIYLIQLDAKGKIKNGKVVVNH